MTLANRLALLIDPIRAAGRAALIDAAVLSLAAVLILTGGGFWLAAGFVMVQRIFGLEAALLLCGLALVVLALGVLVLRLFLRPTRPAPLAAPPPDPLPQLAFDLFFMIGKAWPRRRD